MNSLLILITAALLLAPLPVAFCQPKNDLPPLTQEEKDRIKNAQQAVGAIGAVGVIGFLCMAVAGLCIMVIPIGIALVRGHPDVVAISLISLIFGWTCIGWFVALIWSVKALLIPHFYSRNPCCCFSTAKVMVKCCAKCWPECCFPQHLLHHVMVLVLFFLTHPPSRTSNFSFTSFRIAAAK